jgi:hypothetical protein
MKVEIRIGDTTNNKRLKYFSDKKDDIQLEKKCMYEFLTNNENCIIEYVDEFLLYTLNNGLMAHIVKNNPTIKKYKDDEYNTIPKLNPETYKVFEIKDDGSEISIQDNEGLISKNYFNQLMKTIMDDFYACLNFHDDSTDIQN